MEEDGEEEEEEEVEDLSLGLGSIAACFSLPHTRSRPSADRAFSRFRMELSAAAAEADVPAPSGGSVLHE